MLYKKFFFLTIFLTIFLSSWRQLKVCHCLTLCKKFFFISFLSSWCQLVHFLPGHTIIIYHFPSIPRSRLSSYLYPSPHKIIFYKIPNHYQTSTVIPHLEFLNNFNFKINFKNLITNY
jgi:hypothetical protein